MKTETKQEIWQKINQARTEQAVVEKIVKDLEEKYEDLEYKELELFAEKFKALLEEFPTVKLKTFENGQLFFTKRKETNLYKEHKFYTDTTIERPHY
jgi:hypothetical protein